MNLDNMTTENLNELCSNIREKIIDVVLKNGGHRGGVRCRSR